MRRASPAAIATAVALLVPALAGCPAADRPLAPAAVPGAPKGPAAAAPAGPPPGDPDGVALTLEMATPYFQDGKAAEASRRFALEDWKAARAGFAAALAGEKDPVTRARLRLMIAHCDEAALAHRAAADGFAAALEGLPLLADYLEYRIARALFFAHDSGGAEAHARKVSASSINGAEAELLLGDILRGRGDHAAVAAHYEKYLAERPTGMRRAEARYRLAEALEALRRPRADAIALYRSITIDAPLTRWAERADERIGALLAGLPAAERDAVTTLTADELVTRGMEYFGAMRNEPSEADFDAALAAPGLTDKTRCVASYHRAQSVFKQRNRTRAAPLFDEAFSACDAAGDVDLTVKAAYQAGRSYSNIGKHDVAIVRYRTAEERASGHSFADDARLRQAEEAADLGDDAAVGELLATIPTRYPDGDMKAEALWRLAFRAWKRGADAEAIGWLEKQITAVPIDDNYWAEGQAQYWLGRARLRRGHKDQALDAWQDTVVRYPMSYYALLALNRLREVAPERFEAVRTLIASPVDGDPPLAFAPRAVYGTPGFQRALELLRLGLGEAAEAELRRLGLTPPPGKARVDDPDRIDQIWAMAFLYHQAGRYGQSHWVTRWHVLDFKRRWPAGNHRKRWEIAYPPGWWALLDEHARLNGYPTELLISFVREESAFNPLMESFANAIGLTQMIAPTAKRFAKGTGITVSRETLRDPEKNVTIGSRFLAFLFGKFDGLIALVVPSYNAGEGATARWLRQRGDWATDEWSEEIPYDETRNYSKRVITSYFAYAYLKDGTIPEMPNTIPTRLIPGGVAEGVDARGHKRTKGD